MISEKILKALNDQITKELESSYIYLQMASWLDNKGYKGFANWMKVQAQEEVSHGMILYNYLNDRDSLVELEAIKKPSSSFKSILEVFEEAYAHEKKITKSINEIMTLAADEKDSATIKRLDWFVEEQVEEEASSLEMVEKLKKIKNAQEALLILDKELAGRKFNPPSVLTKN
jgi:ferritin